MKTKWLTRLTVVSSLLFCLQLIQFQAKRDTALLSGMLVTAGLTVLLGCLAECTRRSEARRMPIVSIDATLTSHRTEYVRGARYRSHHDLLYFVTFRTADRQLLEFQVSRLNYEDFDLDETGELRYRGSEFLSFGLMDKSGIPPMAPLPEEYAPPSQPPRRIARQKHSSPQQVSPDACKPSTTGILTHELEER